MKFALACDDVALLMSEHGVKAAIHFTVIHLDGCADTFQWMVQQATLTNRQSDIT